MLRVTAVGGGGRTMAQAVSRQPLSGAVEPCDQITPRCTCGEQSGTGTVFLPVFRLSTVSTIPPPLHIHLSVIRGIRRQSVSGHVLHTHTVAPRRKNNINNQPVGCVIFILCGVL